MPKVADDTKLFRMLKLEADFGDVQNYFMVPSNREISKKADNLISNKKADKHQIRYFRQKYVLDDRP